MKQTKKEIEQTLRQKLQHKFNLEIERLKTRNCELLKSWSDEVKKRQDLQDEVLSLKDKVSQYEDWIHRLQEFVNLPDGEREQAVERFRKEQEASLKFKQYLDSPFIKSVMEIMSLY